MKIKTTSITLELSLIYLLCQLIVPCPNFIMIDWILFFKNHVVLTVLCLDSLIQHNVLKTASCFLFYYILSSVYQCSYWWPPRLIPGFSNTNKAAMNIFVKGIGEHYVLISFGLNIYLWSCWIIEKICFLFSFNCRSSPKWFVPFHTPTMNVWEFWFIQSLTT